MLVPCRSMMYATMQVPSQNVAYGEVDGKPWEVDASELIERLKGRGRAASDATVVEVRAVRTPARCADSARNASV